MIKLLAMSLFVVIGAAVGAAFYHLTSHSLADNRKIPLVLCLVLGVMGAFAGIWIADLADIHMIGNVIDNILFATVGSALFLGLNLLIRSRGQRS